MNKVFIPGKIGPLETLIVTPQSDGLPARTAVICHPHPLYGGTMDNKVVATLAKAFQNCGIQTVRFNFRGVGKSAGSFGEGRGEQEDLLAILGWLKGGGASHPIWLAGFSFGAYVAFEVSKKCPIEHLILVAPPVQHFTFQVGGEFNTPLLLIQGEADEIVPSLQVYEWAKSQTFPIKTLRFQGVGHFFHGHLADLRLQLEAHAKNMLPALRPPPPAGEGRSNR